MCAPAAAPVPAAVATVATLAAGRVAFVFALELAVRGAAVTAVAAASCLGTAPVTAGAAEGEVECGDGVAAVAAVAGVACLGTPTGAASAAKREVEAVCCAAVPASSG